MRASWTWYCLVLGLGICWFWALQLGLKHARFSYAVHSEEIRVPIATWTEKKACFKTAIDEIILSDASYEEGWTLNKARTCLIMPQDQLLVNKTAILLERLIENNARWECGAHVALFDYGLAPALSEISPEKNGKVKLEIVDKGLGVCNASHFTVWVGVYGVEQHGIILKPVNDGRCAWGGVVHLRHPGVYVAKGHILYHQGLVQEHGHLCSTYTNHIWAGKGLSLIESVVNPKGRSPFCCELCTRTPECTHWNNHVKGLRCDLFKQKSSAIEPELQASSETHSGVSRNETTTQLLSSHTYFKHGSTNISGHRELCGADSDRLLMGWKQSFELPPSSTNQLDRTKLPICRTFTEMTKGRWVLKETNVSVSNLRQWPSKIYYSEDPFEDSTLNITTTSNNISHLRLPRFWEPDTCRLTPLNRDQVLTCLNDRGVRNVVFRGDSMISNLETDFKSFLGPLKYAPGSSKILLPVRSGNRTWPIKLGVTRRGVDTEHEKSIMIQNLAIIHQIWHTSVDRFKARVKEDFDPATSKVYKVNRTRFLHTVFLGAPYLFGEREPHDTGPRALLFNQAVREAKEHARTKNKVTFLDYAAITKSRGYTFTGYSDGMHYGTPEHHVIIQMISNFICNGPVSTST